MLGLSVSPAMKVAIAYGATSFSAVALCGVFNLFTVDIFATVYKIEERYFTVIQLLFLVWNAINDPLFGWYFDSRPAGSRRIPLILYGGPVWCLAFMLPWFQWGSSPGLVGLHFFVSLFLFDGLYTFVVLAHCALMADIASSEVERTRLNTVSAVMSLFGALPVYLCSRFYAPHKLAADTANAVAAAAFASVSSESTAALAATINDTLRPFQYACGAVACVACIGFLVTGTLIRESHSHTHSSPSVSGSTSVLLPNHSATAAADEVPSDRAGEAPAIGLLSNSGSRRCWAAARRWGGVAREIVTNRHFLLFVSMNLIQVRACPHEYFPWFSATTRECVLSLIRRTLDVVFLANCCIFHPSC